MENLTIGFIGLGLIGGSIAKTIKKVSPNTRIIAYDRVDVTLESAFGSGIINERCFQVDEHFAVCDYIFLCMPVSYNANYLELLKEIIKNDCIITDAGSVKSNIHRKVIELGIEENFIGGHPMAGSERTGYDSSSDILLENAYYIITPSDKSAKHQVAAYYELVKRLGAIPIILDYEEHDYVTAAVSHVPHVIASGLVKMIKDSDNSKELMKTIAAGGFRDLTRIAASSPVMWQQICLTNRKNVCKVLDDYINVLQSTKDLIFSQDGDAIHDFFDEAFQYRRDMPFKRGLLEPVYELYCDISDKAGAIAKLATVLADNHISIKNIGIIHNREYEQGALHIEFYEKKVQEDAIELLEAHNYFIYNRT